MLSLRGVYDVLYLVVQHFWSQEDALWNPISHSTAPPKYCSNDVRLEHRCWRWTLHVGQTRRRPQALRCLHWMGLLPYWFAILGSPMRNLMKIRGKVCKVRVRLLCSAFAQSKLAWYPVSLSIAFIILFLSHDYRPHHSHPHQLSTLLSPLTENKHTKNRATQWRFQPHPERTASALKAEGLTVLALIFYFKPS